MIVSDDPALYSRSPYSDVNGFQKLGRFQRPTVSQNHLDNDYHDWQHDPSAIKLAKTLKESNAWHLQSPNVNMFASTHLPVPEPFGDTIMTYNNQQQSYISDNISEWNDANVGANNGPSAIFYPSLLNYASSASRQSLRLHETNLCEEDEDLEDINGEPERHLSGSALGMNSRKQSQKQGGTGQHLESSGWIWCPPSSDWIDTFHFPHCLPFIQVHITWDIFIRKNSKKNQSKSSLSPLSHILCTFFWNTVFVFNYWLILHDLATKNEC